MDREKLVERLRGMRERLAEDGVTHLALFGSRARGDHREDSDLDLLIEVDEERKFSLVNLVRVEAKLADALELPVSIVMRRSLEPAFARRIAPDIADVF